jgi:transcription antitermination factor NusG
VPNVPFVLRTSEPGESSSHSWFALWVKSNREKIVAEAATRKGYENFLPLYRSRRRWSDRYRDIDLPLFPGYVFCRLDVRKRLPLLTIPSVVQIVGIGKVPIPVDDDEIAAIRTLVWSGLSLQPWPLLEAGHRVRIAEGPLRNVEGIVIEIKGSYRLIVSITLLQRSVAVAINRSWVRPMEPQRALQCARTSDAPRVRYPSHLDKSSLLRMV